MQVRFWVRTEAANCSYKSKKVSSWREPFAELHTDQDRQRRTAKRASRLTIFDADCANLERAPVRVIFREPPRKPDATFEFFCFLHSIQVRTFLRREVDRRDVAVVVAGLGRRKWRERTRALEKSKRFLVERRAA
jgi:hypothetical protein